MLQGPVGPFFTSFAKDLNAAGAVVFKINFNGGDWLFSSDAAFSSVYNFSGKAAAWPDYLRDLLTRLKIDIVFLFGDCRPMHVAAIATGRELGIRFGVFEEGYLRPDYITLEREGVNDNSSLPGNPAFYLAQARFEPVPCEPLGSTYGQAAKWGMLYFAATSLARWRFRHYKHHRRLGIADAPFWLLSFWRKFVYAVAERKVLPSLITEHSGKFFLVSLQTRGDAQMSIHSDFKSIEQFIEHVVLSFAKNAPKGSLLALKHHPLDRGYSDYTALIKQLTAEHQLEGRCLYIHDQHLPTLLQHAGGVVVVNSTAGLSAVGEGVPVKVCGRSIYDIEGLTFKGPLDAFWQNAHLSVPEHELYTAFKSYLISHTQHRGSFYKPMPGVSFSSGVMWTDHGLKAPHHDVEAHQHGHGRAPRDQFRQATERS